MRSSIFFYQFYRILFTMEIFPHILARIGGKPYECLEQMQTDKLPDIAKKVIALESVAAKLKQELSDHLYSLIGRTDDPAAQNFLLNLRRDVFNNRSVKNKVLQHSLTLLPQATYTMLERYISTHSAIDKIEREGEEQYTKALKKLRTAMQSLATDSTLQHGLLLSSKSLLINVEKYIAQKQGKLGKKALKAELSLLKYLTRTCTKTSPFSTFTQLSIAQACAEQALIKGVFCNKTDAVFSSHIRFNNYLFKYLKELIFANEPLAQHLTLRLNPTISLKEKQYNFLINKNQIDVFQYLQQNQVLTCIHQYLQSHTSAAITPLSLCSYLQQHVNAGEDEIKAYLFKIIQLGFLEFHLGISGTDPYWDKKLIEKLQPILAHQHGLIPLFTQLRQMRYNADKYANTASTTDRKTIQESTLQIYQSICSSLQETDFAEPVAIGAGASSAHSLSSPLQKTRQAAPGDLQEKQLPTEDFPFRAENIFYEDTRKHVQISIDHTALHTLTQKLSQLLDQLRLFDIEVLEKQKMQEFFLNKYDEKARINLLNFYEDYYREVKTLESDPKHKQATLQQLPEQLRRRHLLTKRWRQELFIRLRDRDDTKKHVRLDGKLLEEINQTIGFEATEKPASNAAFIQLFKETNAEGKTELKGVLNNYLTGYGKFMSRYMHIFPDQVHQDTKRWNENTATSDELLAENCDGSYFNANIHPSLMPYEISAPGSHNSLASDQQIPLGELEVCYHQEHACLELRHQKSNKKVLPFDMGFQANFFRSELFKLLSQFSDSDTIMLSPLKQVVDRLNIPSDAIYPYVRLSPRIMYEDNIIIRRKSWLIPQELLPHRKGQETDWQYYRKIRQWQQSLSLPEEVFVKVSDISPLANNQDAAAFANDDYKPQYIDFRNPLLINLFQKAIGRVKKHMIIEEMYPRPDQMLRIGEQKYVTEFLLQWYHS
ncbi:hypothetical protein OKW21_004633 [Catalinimonas alkaloidigena]|uniref:lantibiotic dehydratase n=1 Tax=Catalinimonas alkaloidigena TaxID=1075417 RepID=UPI002404EA21|nr:lantibiotic dehydratase [Catalinimonas alkaloidigena]MDF9799370.1 hypothetical protein [Catalinimonas alkaloidigena]